MNNSSNFRPGSDKVLQNFDVLNKADLPSLQLSSITSKLCLNVFTSEIYTSVLLTLGMLYNNVKLHVHML